MAQLIDFAKITNDKRKSGVLVIKHTTSELSEIIPIIKKMQGMQPSDKIKKNLKIKLKNKNVRYICLKSRDK